MARCPSEDWDRYIESEERAADAQEEGRIDEMARALCAHYWGDPDASWERMSRYAFKYTTCGISFYHDDKAPGRVIVSGYCEGTDATCEAIVLNWPFTRADVEDAVKQADQDGIDLWNRTHGCDDCGEEDEFGDRAINTECKTCKGEGIII